MEVVKVLNNSLVLSKDKDGKTIIVMGKGIGFNHSKGDTINEELIEKIFTPKDPTDTKEYVRILASAPREYVENIYNILQDLKNNWQHKLDDRYFLILLDHIAFAIERVNNGFVFQNKLLNEVRIYYPEEYEAGLMIVSKLNNTLQINLPEEEAGNIAFHLVNAKKEDKNFEKTVLSMQLLKDILNLVQYKLNISFDSRSMRYNRFVTHLQYFIHRILENKQLDTRDEFLFNQVKNKHPAELKVAMSIADYCNKMTDIDITSEEMLYIIIHLIRLTNQDN
ncbi:transcription antiterminator BglG [Halolactibacillus alkaliphilus]|uniref:Transcription antiterminator BglG n=1 Tax=Halolactibacillus alkaliphilus TaxID=442899 RepID=A0A511X260_9BACI|nr:PRD domain-containing protein [Halolactibacillus alkaliphilus]GEN57035.1 transcription antiterminator BglG [Halolactibacillus alkaliphilus]GGN68536.1 transcription antiterminator BglG [Halolactibacillus alkaliphilus]SFO85777.1 transcriptional antiterminator, BglG family [Halolactibacillus alkaliphilus]